MSEEVAKYEFELKEEDIKKYIAPGASDKELFMFMGIARSYGLNPMKREIHFVKRKWKDDQGTWHERGDVVVGYEVYIKRAERLGLIDGWECTSDGKKAFVTIYRKDRSKPFKWEVDRAEFDTGQSTWKKMPSFMLKKVAIAQAFRLCFPEDLGGLPYMPEEIQGTSSEQLPSGDPTQSEPQATQQVDDIPDFTPPPKPDLTPPKESENISDAQRKRFYAIYKKYGKTDAEAKAFLYAKYGIEHSADILKKDYDDICQWAKSRVPGAEG